MRAIKVRAKVGAEEELWVLPLGRLVAIQWAKLKSGGAFLHLHFDRLTLTASDPDGALLEEANRALEGSDGTYAIGGLWSYEWVE